MSQEDRWLLPRHQTEYPARDLVSEAQLHGRREATSLVLAATFFVATISMLVYGVRSVIDVGALLPQIELPVALQIPFGVVPFALAFVVVAMTCELLGRRRATALVSVGWLASSMALGLVRLADVIDGRGVSFNPTLGLATCSALALVVHVLVFDALRTRMQGRAFSLRLVVSTMAAQVVGWAAFAAVMFATEHADTTPLVLGSALYLAGSVVLLTLPALVVARFLRLFLRVGRFERLPPAMIVEDLVEDEPRPRRRAQRASIHPYSSAEMRFFTEGDQLAEASLDS